MSTHILRAKLMHDKRTYRDIEIPSDRSLYNLAEAIIASFDFDLDHAFGFYSELGRNYFDAQVQFELFSDMGENERPDLTGNRPKPGSVEKTRLGKVFIEPKQKMQFLFDYGDEWCFEIEVRGFGEKVKGTDYPRLVAVKGPSPEQYPDWEDDDYA